MVKTWITREQGKLDSAIKEVYALERALEALKEEELFLVECKCFDNLRWPDIAISVEARYKKKVDEGNLRQKLVRIKQKIINFLKR
ncbi:hypothetical protein D3C71_2035870 [compost metagenome]